MQFEKKPIVEQFKKHPTDTGSTEVQVALLSSRIAYLTEHFKKFPKDFASKNGFLKLIGQRRKLLQYIKERDFEAYSALIKRLDLRK